MTMTHTPGPWKVVYYSDGEPLYIGPDATHWVARVAGESEEQIPRGEKRANACLIKAAPDLLHTLEHVLKVSEHSMKTEALIREVLHKATAVEPVLDY